MKIDEKRRKILMFFKPFNRHHTPHRKRIGAASHLVLHLVLQ